MGFDLVEGDESSVSEFISNDWLSFVYCFCGANSGYAGSGLVVFFADSRNLWVGME